MIVQFREDQITLGKTKETIVIKLPASIVHKKKLSMRLKKCLRTKAEAKLLFKGEIINSEKRTLWLLAMINIPRKGK